MGGVCRTLFAHNISFRVRGDAVSGIVQRLRAYANFLDGAAPIEGVWFGDNHPEHRGLFWWRKQMPITEAAADIEELCLAGMSVWNNLLNGDIEAHTAQAAASLEFLRAAIAKATASSDKGGE